MDQDYAGNNETARPGLKKYRQAGYGFLGLSVAYLLIAIVFLPPFSPEDMTRAYTLSVPILVTLGIVTLFICRGKKLLVQILAVIYAVRSAFTLLMIAEGSKFPPLPYFLPCLVITFYLLGRAAWDWP